MRRFITGIILSGLLLGCSADPRKEAYTHLKIIHNATEIYAYRNGPAPFWVEDELVTRITILDEQGNPTKIAEASYNPNSEKSSSLFGKAISAILGFLGGLIAQ